MKKHTIFIVAGEPSGDLHGANLAREIRRIEPGVVIQGVGGEKMSATGIELRHDLAKEAIMGFTEVLEKFGRIRAVFRDTVKFLEENRPDLLILIDYPGFNLRLAGQAKRLGIRTVYYICPQVWAWGKRRVGQIARLVEKVIVILDFEKSIYEGAGLSVEFVGHPLIDHIQRTPLDQNYVAEHETAGGVVLGLLPGSRPQEVRRHLPIMLRSVELLHQELPESRFLVACPNEQIDRLARQVLDKWRARHTRRKQQSLPHVEIACGKTYEVIKLSSTCLVASGTATLETAYFLKPMVVIYMTSFGSWLLARSIIEVEHIAMVNIFAGKRVVPEFIQSGARPETIAAEVLDLLRNDQRRADIERDLREVRERLGRPGASERAARAVVDILERPTAGPEPDLWRAVPAG
jgi:lipid-A-disaccharide synthase